MKALRLTLYTLLAGFGLFLMIAGSLPDALSAPVTQSRDSSGKVLVLTMQGPIGPALSGYLDKGIAKATRENSELILIELDTPGGLLTTTREMTQRILESPVPVAVYVSPSGARAASAGTFILYSAHIAAMAEGTNVGAATPIQMQGSVAQISKDIDKSSGKTPENLAEKPDENSTSSNQETKENESSESGSEELTMDKLRDLIKDPNKESLKKKAVEDSSAFIKGLAELRGRNAEWAVKAVTDASSITADQALEKNVINILSNSRWDLLEQMDGREVKMSEDKTRKLETKNAQLVEFPPDWKTRLLSLITDPNVAMILMSIGVYGLILEFYNPGAMIPGVIGAISLTLGLYAMNILPINAAGAVLCLLGVIFMMAEFFIPSFGIMGFGGFISFIGGLTILFETSSMPGLTLDPGVIWGVGLLGALVIGLVVWMAITAQRRKPSTGLESMIGETGEVVSWSKGKGIVRIQGETWQAVPYQDKELNLSKGQNVRIQDIDRLTLKISEP